MRFVDHGAQIVVVPELDLIDRYGVVLVEDGDDLPGEEGEDRVPGIEVAPPVVQVIPRDQDLGDPLPVPAEGLFVDHHQGGLAHGGEGLLLGERSGPLAESGLLHARTRWPRSKRG